jgi:tetratricopeptide (TPR) repeat protein
MIVLWLLIAAGTPAFGNTEPMHVKAAVVSYDTANTSLEKKSFDEAIAKFRQALEIEPTFIDAYEGLVRACLDSGKRLEAGAAIAQLLQIEPDLSRYRVLLGQILLEQKQVERALAQFSFVLQKDPANADALFGFATAAKDSGMEDRASDALEQGRKLHPQDRRFRISGRAEKSP